MTLDAPQVNMDRFHRVLVEEIRRTRPDYLSSPFTVAEIYQDLVPYSTHRDLIGVEMNGDYEDLLLRLLAGQGDYLILESEHARDRLREELESANPETGLYREFAAVDVRLNPDRLDAPPENGSEAVVATPSESVPVEDLAPLHVEFPPKAEAEGMQSSSEPSSSESAENSEDGEGDVPANCSWCRGELPRRENLNYCPFCGADMRVVPCTSCGEALEPDWRFCIACGAEVGEE